MGPTTSSPGTLALQIALLHVFPGPTRAMISLEMAVSFLPYPCIADWISIILDTQLDPPSGPMSYPNPAYRIASPVVNFSQPYLSALRTFFPWPFFVL